MKNIFIATDFSEASLNAAKYAVALAGHFNSTIFLFNAYQTPVSIPESYIFFTVEQVGEEVMMLLEKEEKIISRYGMVPIEKCMAEGNPVNTILSEATKRKADLIVCGMKGSGKILKRIFGSTATDLARQTNIPLIIVPENTPFHLPDNIAFASDNKTIPGVQNILTLKQIGTQFNSKLSVVSVADDGANDSFEFREKFTDFIEALQSMKPSLEALEGSDIPAVLEKYIKDHAVNLIVLIPHEHGFLSGIFGGSITKHMSFLSDVPVLILPEKRDEA
ncbi:MAG: universal stress protein [Ferruginibacter sp.]|nr:universal stress protein [Ferruginibacter sp.]